MKATNDDRGEFNQRVFSGCDVDALAAVVDKDVWIDWPLVSGRVRSKSYRFPGLQMMAVIDHLGRTVGCRLHHFR